MSHFVRAFILLLAFVFLLSAKSLANPGDTTWVQAQNDVQPDWYNDFDTPVNFPSGTVRLSYHNYSGGFTGNIKFAFIEGTPPHKPPVHAAFYYYRLKLYYADGSWKYSNNIRLSPVASSEYAVAIRPVPFDDEITIRSTLIR
jgi:hypothetical protein